ncbi:ABC transporter substrate-binding protein [Nocardioides sp. AE5]|uniref:ABC transporter substrate-binding protein n=1 Tax=Nocardioides sp. AE5 TaxID=2962573 RepID=UPI0028817483|nr:ABC transporter substrate-binding protein [Nocardioides sp. AE5]MDT0202249.1 ABC transporter substrate-binding protein [Nocardioides sp. AE5]
MPKNRTAPNVRTRLKIAAAVALALSVAACGSQLDPETVAQVNGTNVTGGQAGGGDSNLAGGGDAGVVDGGDPAAGDLPADEGGAVGGDSGPADAGGSSGGGGGSTASSGGGGTSGSPSSGANSAGGAGPKVSCDGFKNQTGITNDKITIANASDISGPVPGIFSSAQDATRAYAAYFNANSSICGRKLEVQLLDSRTDAGADQQAYAKACESAFATVGSMSAFDSGGAATAQKCGLPDIRSTIVNPERQKCTTCFAAQAVDTGVVPDAMAKWFVQNFKDATQHVAVLYIDAGASPPNAKAQAAAWGKAGWKVDYLQGIKVDEFNFATYVQQMKNKGIKMVHYLGPLENSVKLQQAMKQQNFKPDVIFFDATAYDAKYVKQAGDLGNGVYVYMSNDLFTNTKNKEMQLYMAWLQQVKPGAVPNFYGLYAWSATRLFVEQSLALGGNLNRANLVAGLKKVDKWTANGLHAPYGVGPGKGANCQKVIQLNNGQWKQVSPGDYMCGSMIRG